MNSAIRTLRSRGMLSAVTAELPNNITSPSVYCGFDPTAESLHVGNLVQAMALRHFQKAGVKPIVLIGGATGMIGDPSGKAEDRVLLTEEAIHTNVMNLHKSLQNVLEFESTSIREVNTVNAKLCNNYDWHNKMSAVQWMRDAGRYFRVNSMLSKESVKRRLDSDQGISFLEFSYQLFQAYDFLHLYKNENCVLQIGGTDQWGNITAGCDLVRKAIGKEVYGATLPLLTTSNGEKYGKSAGNAIWLDENKTSVYEFYQYFLRSDDRDLKQLLHTFTFDDMNYIDEILNKHNDAPEKRIGQAMLAEKVTRLIHGEDGLDKAKKITNFLFGGSLQGLKAKEIKSSMADAPQASLPMQNVVGKPITNVVVEAGICKSKAECRRLVIAGGLYLNNDRVMDQNILISPNDVIEGQFLLFRTGRKKYLIVNCV